MNGLDLERPARVRAVYDVLMSKQASVDRAAVISVTLGIGLDRARLALDVLRSHDDLSPSCTTHGTCLHSSWDIASQIVDAVSEPWSVGQ